MSSPGKNFLPEWVRKANAAAADAAAAAPAAGTAQAAAGPGGTFVPSWARAKAVRRLVRGGTCVVPGHRARELDILLENGIIRALGQDLDPAGCEVVDAKGLYVLPGLVDPHVHIGIFSDFAEELHTETRSALLNGVTTIGLYAGGPDPYLKTLDRTISLIRERSHTDVFIHLPIFNREQLEEIPLYASRYGILSFKAYMCGIPGLIPSADDAFLLDIMEAVAALGPKAVLNIHAENAPLVERAAARGLAASPGGLDSAAWAKARPGYVEEEAVRRAEFLSRVSGARIYFVHISSAGALDEVRRLKREGRTIMAETTSPYLAVEPAGVPDSRALMVPPVRGGEDREALWQGFEDGTIDAVGTDHTPLSSAQKDLDSIAPRTMPGYPAVGTHLPFLYDEAKRRGLPVELLARKACRAPAEIFGIFPRKGTLLPGSDADLVLVHPDRKSPVTAARAASRSDFALREGERLAGHPVLVIKGGEPVSAGGSLPRGEYLPRR